MSPESREEKLLEQKVAYTVLVKGRFFIVEHVPARVDPETGEQYFSPETVERLREIVWSERRPVRLVQTPVFEFA